MDSNATDEKTKPVNASEASVNCNWTRKNWSILCGIGCELESIEGHSPEKLKVAKLN